MTTASDIPAALLKRARPLTFGDVLALETRGGGKTETRRVITQEPVLQWLDEEGNLQFNPFRWGLDCPPYQYDGRGPSQRREEGQWYADEQTAVDACKPRHIPPRYGEAGDLLWMQEGYQIQESYGSDTAATVIGEYSADGEPFEVTLSKQESQKFAARKKPYAKLGARFMYKSLSRTLLQVEDWWPERVQEITYEGVEAEGIHAFHVDDPSESWWDVPGGPDAPKRIQTDSIIEAFAHLWDDINASRGYPFGANPWVRAVRFSRVTDLQALL